MMLCACGLPGEETVLASHGYTPEHGVIIDVEIAHKNSQDVHRFSYSALPLDDPRNISPHARLE